MRANEFLTEEPKRGKQLDAQKKVSPGAVFTTDGYYDLYRAMGLIGRLPADTSDIDPYSFITKLPMIVTYTDEERDMVKKAFAKLGVPCKELTPFGSEEPKAINNVSPTVAFKGYPR